MARSEAFTLDEIVTCSSAYTRVFGRQDAQDGAVSILITAVVEGLNLLEVVTARRVVAQVSISIPKENGPLEISLTGSRFEGLQLAGREFHPKLNPKLEWMTHDPKSGNIGCYAFEDAANPTKTCGQIVDIPGFGRITLGALLAGLILLALGGRSHVLWPAGDPFQGAVPNLSATAFAR